jgi:hypothetical protein
MTKVKPKSNADTTNPKDLVGDTKVSLTKLPAVAIVHGAHAMMDGAKKYGAYNWRAKKVVAHIYVDAALRHLTSWFEGEELASDSKVHHLGHAIACCAILLDAQETGNLVDDRPVDDANRAMLTRVLDRLKKQIEFGAAPAPKSPVPQGHELCDHIPCDECLAAQPPPPPAGPPNEVFVEGAKPNFEPPHHATCSCDECKAVRLANF